MKVGKIKQLSKKSLSVLLAVIMIMTSMSVCFGTISFAAESGASDTEWNALASALKTDAVKNASFTGNKYTKIVTDPDGTLVDAVDAWWTVFNKVKENVGDGKQDNAYRTAPQVNAKIAAKLQSLMGDSYYTTYNVASFLSGCIAGVGDSDIQSGTTASGEDKNANNISNNLSPATTIKLTVNLAGILSYDSVDDLPDGDMATKKTYTITHRNSNYYQTEETKEETTGSGCDAKKENVTYYTKHFYYVIDSTSAVEGDYQSTSVLKTSKATLDANSKYLSADLDTMISYIRADADAAATAKNAINTAKTNVDTFNPNAWSKYFTAYDVTGFNSKYTLATEIIGLANVCINLYALMDAGYDDILTNETALRTLHGTLTSGLASFDGATADARSYVTSHAYDGRYFVRADVQTYTDAVYRQLCLVELRRIKIAIDNALPTYYDYNEDTVTGENATVGGAALTVVKGEVDSFISTLSQSKYTNDLIVDAGLNGYKDGLTGISNEFSRLIKISGYNDQFSAKYEKYLNEIYDATAPEKSTEDLMAALKGSEGVEGYDAWYTGLKSLLATIENDIGKDVADKIFEDNAAKMTARMDLVYATLYGRVKGQVDSTYELYMAMVNSGSTITLLNVTNYSKYKQAFKNLDKDTYNYLKNSSNFTMPQETIDKYNALKDDFSKLEAFLATGGFNSFSQVLGEYVNREVLGTDLIRDEAFVVNSDKVANIVTALDKLITSDEIGDLLGGLLGNEEGEDFDIGTMLEELVVDMLFSDSFINTAVQMLYSQILGALLGVWEKDLPNASVDMGMDIMSMLQKDLYTIINDMGLALYPDQYAAALRSIDPTRYAENIAKLQTATRDYTVEKETELNADGKTIVTDVTVTSSPWDKEGSVFLNEDGTLNLTWGVDEYKKTEGVTTEQIKDFFYARFDDACTSIAPLFYALIGNTTWTGKSNEAAKYSIATLALTITASGNDGYANMLVPIYEALGAVVEGTAGATFTYKAPSTISGYSSKSDRVGLMLAAILEPIFGLLDEIGNAPLSTIINILPNLCYALSMQMLNPLLNQLKTTIKLGGDAGLLNYVIDGCGDRFGIDDRTNLYSLDLALGDILGDINDLIDLSGGINSLLSMLGLPLPEIEQGKVAQMGKITQRATSRKAYIYTGLEGTGKANYIEADKGAVLYYLLNYIFDILENEEAFRGLLSMLITVKDENGEAVKDAEGNSIPDEAKIEETIASFNELGLFAYGKSNAIAAIVELFNNETFAFGDYVWYDGAVWEGSTVTNLDPAMVAYLSYNSSLTEGKAEYIVENLDAIIGSIIDMVNGNEEGTFSIAAKLNELIGGLFTNETITELAKALSVIDINALLAGDAAEGEGEATEPGADDPATVAEGEEGEEDGSSESAATEEPAIDINDLIKELLGIDLTPFAAYADLADDTDWGVTDAATFAAALSDVLAPFGPVIDFILKGEDLKVIYDAAQPSITLKGYNGYDSAIVPLLESLGIDAPALGADDDAIEVILGAVLGLLETFTGTDADGKPVNAIDGMLDALIGLLYFIQSDGLTVAVNNLLIPVYALLDAIRPIYELNLNDLLGSLLAESGISINFNSLVLDVNFVLDLVKTLTGLDLAGLDVVIADVCKVAVADYTSESSLIGANGKKGAYTEFFDGADLVAVIINYILDWARTAENVDALAALIGGENAETAEKVKTYVDGIYDLIAGIEPEYIDANWAYAFSEGFDEAIFSSGISVTPTIESLRYPTDWTEDSAKYLDENLDALIAAAFKLAGVEGNLSDMLKSKINFLTGENLDKLVTLLVDLLGKLNTEVVDAAGVLIGADLDALRAYKAPEIVATEDETATVVFAKELAKILGVIPEVVNLVFFAEDFTLFNKANGSAAATIKGGRGYAKGLALILEALGCKNLPAEAEIITKDNKEDEDTTITTAEAVEAILVSIANRFDEILDDPINEILNVLPNVIYFINANGVGTAANNLLACVTGFMGQLKESFGVDVDLVKIINDAINGLIPEDADLELNLLDLNVEKVFALVEVLLGLDLSAATDILATFCVGKINPYTSVSGETAFKMEYDDNYARYDMITILVTIALMIVSNENNAKALDEMLGTEIISALKTVFDASEITYSAPDWNYPLADNGTVDAMKYSITYPNNWTDKTAEYVTANLPEIADMIAGMIDSNYTSLAGLLQANVNVFTAETLDSLVAEITKLLGGIDAGLLNAAGMLLNVDVAGLKAYKAPEIKATEDATVTEAFAAELANVLKTYAPGVVEWLLLGRDYTFFVDETKMVDGIYYEDSDVAGKALITISGANGYAEGLALLLEALGCKNLPDVYNKTYTTAEVVELTLASVAARIDAILTDPVTEVLAMLPNLLYFLNTNGVAAVFDNLTAALTALLEKLAAFGLEVDINSLIDIKTLMGIEDTDATISLDNLALADILQAVSYMTGLNITLIEDVLVGFALGKVEAYTSISKNCGETKRMIYADEYDVNDMVTVLVNLVLLTLTDEENEAFVIDLVGGEDVYGVILSFINPLADPIEEFDWKFKDNADTGYVFSAISASDFYGGSVYGDIYTEEMAQYIADNFGEFVDNIVYLLGININGQSVDNLKELLNGLVSGSLYNSENVVAIRDALAGLLGSIEGLEVNGTNIGKYIVAVVENSGIADLGAVAEVEVADFTEDREAFVAALCDVLEPLYGVFKYLLADDDFSFFADLDKSSLIKLTGAQGYAYGIIPLLEVLGVPADDILTPAEYEAAIAKDANVVITAFLNPLLDRVDVILDNPAEEILDMLPNLIYFINSNGVDTVVKNTLSAVYKIIYAIEPIKEIDLYELIGLDLATLDFEKLFDMLLDMIAESTGYEFTALDASAVVELSVGTLESYTSKNGNTAYKMVYASTDEVEGGKTEMVTVVERLLLTFIMHENNQEMLIGLLKDNLGMSADGEKYMRAVLKLVADCTLDTKLGMETALATLYYIYYGADIGVGESATGLKDLNAEWTAILKEMRESTNKEEAIAGEIISELLGLDIFQDIIDPEEGIAPNGLVAFFQKIAAFFQKIADWFKNLFN